MTSSSDEKKPVQLLQRAWLPAVLLILVQLAGGMRDLPQSSFFPIYLQERLSMAPAVISIVVVVGQIAGLVALLGGSITARLGSKWVLVCGLLLSGLSSLAFQVPLPGVVPFVWVLSGAGTALTTVGGASYLTRIGGKGALGVLAAFYALSMTTGGAIGNPLAGWIITQYGFIPYSWTIMGISAAAILLVLVFMKPIQGQPTQAVSLDSFWQGIRATTRQSNVRLLVALRCLPTIFYGTLSLLIPLLLNSLTGSKLLVGAYGTTNLVVASAAQLLAGRSADRWGARVPTLVAYSAAILAGIGLAASAGTVWGLFGFGVLGIAAAWSLSTLMYVWVNDGVQKDDHPSTFGLLHAVWSLSMISGSLLGGWFVSTAPGLPFLATGLLNLGSLFLIVVYYRRSSVGSEAAGS
jgi:MFS family permease